MLLALSADGGAPSSATVTIVIDFPRLGPTPGTRRPPRVVGHRSQDRISSDDRCNTDLATLATPASRNLTRPGARGHGGHWNRWRRSCRCAGRRESANDSSFFRCRGRTVGGDEHAANAASAAVKTEDHRLVVRVRGALEPRCRFDHGVARAVCVAASVAAQLFVRGDAEVCGVPTGPERFDLFDDGGVGHALNRTLRASRRVRGDAGISRSTCRRGD